MHFCSVRVIPPKWLLTQFESHLTWKASIEKSLLVTQIGLGGFVIYRETLVFLQLSMLHFIRNMITRYIFHFEEFNLFQLEQSWVQFKTVAQWKQQQFNNSTDTEYDLMFPVQWCNIWSGHMKKKLELKTSSWSSVPSFSHFWFFLPMNIYLWKQATKFWSLWFLWQITFILCFVWTSVIIICLFVTHLWVFSSSCDHGSRQSLAFRKQRTAHGFSRWSAAEVLESYRHCSITHPSESDPDLYRLLSCLPASVDCCFLIR